MYPGVAEYREPGREPYRIFVGEEVIKNMDASFQGRPVYVRHVDQVDLDNIQQEADGWVVRSFFNPVDGKHWVEFLAVSDRAHEAIAKGWKLSNAYVPKTFAGGGIALGVEYAKEVMSGEYEHLAIVPNPRYEESVIMTPEEFKVYNGEKELELKRLANDKGEKPMLNLWKKTKVDNATDLEGTMVLLPKSKTEMTIAQVVNELDDYKLTMKEPQMANGEHHVMVGEHKMTVNALVEKHLQCMNELEEMKKKHPPEAAEHNDEDAEAKKKALELAAHEEKEIAAKKEHAAKAGEEGESEGEKKKNEIEEAKKKKENFDSLKNAPKLDLIHEMPRIDLSDSKIARGKQRYGSN